MHFIQVIYCFFVQMTANKMVLYDNVSLWSKYFMLPWSTSCVFVSVCIHLAAT